MAGRRPTPTKLRILRGNPRQKPINGAEPDAPALLDETPPMNLEGVALREWNRALGSLREMGLLSDVNRLVLAGYCEAFAEFDDAFEKLKKEGPTFTTDKGYVCANPLVGIKNAAALRMKQFAIEFGFTPAALSKVKGPTKKAESAFAAFAKKRA